jgi:hypothetical protein
LPPFVQDLWGGKLHIFLLVQKYIFLCGVNAVQEERRVSQA